MTDLQIIHYLDDKLTREKVKMTRDTMCEAHNHFVRAALLCEIISQLSEEISKEIDAKYEQYKKDNIMKELKKI